MNGIKRKSITQEVTDYQYCSGTNSEDEMIEVANFYFQLEGSDACKKNSRFVRGY